MGTASDLLESATVAPIEWHGSFADEGERKKFLEILFTPTIIDEALRSKPHASYRNPKESFTFRENNGEFEIINSGKCSYLLLGHSNDLTRLQPFLDSHVVNHELAHSIHYGVWLKAV